MNTIGIRRKLHHFIDTIEDKKAAAIYTPFEENIKNNEEDYTDEFKAELDRRYEEYKKDGKVITREAMDKRIKKILATSK